LIPISRIDRLVNTAEGIVVHFRCWCGYRGLWLTGRSQNTRTMTSDDVGVSDSSNNFGHDTADDMTATGDAATADACSR
jgi:hypothetical protein